MTAKIAVITPVRKASCVSTSIATSNEAAAKGIAKFQSAGSLSGAGIRPPPLAPKMKPTFITAVEDRRDHARQKSELRVDQHRDEQRSRGERNREIPERGIFERRRHSSPAPGPEDEADLHHRRRRSP